MLVLEEAESRSRFLNLVVASLVALRKEKAGGGDHGQGSHRWQQRELREHFHSLQRPGASTSRWEPEEAHAGKTKLAEATFGSHGKRQRSPQTSKCPSTEITGTRFGVSSKGGAELFVSTVGSFASIRSAALGESGSIATIRNSNLVRS